MSKISFATLLALIIIYAGMSACKKDSSPKPAVTQTTNDPVVTEPDYFARIAGEWNCRGENKADHVAFSSPTTWTAMDTALLLTNHIMKIEKVSDVAMQVTCMGYDQNMFYSNVGTTFEKCQTKSDDSKVTYVERGEEPLYGYGNRRSLTYYIKQDSIYYSSSYKSDHDNFSIVVSGQRK